MPLPVDNPRWQDLRTAYGPPADLLALLRQAYAEGVNSDRLADIMNEIRHQGDTSEAMYAVAPHLLMLAQTDNLAADPEMKRHLLQHLGLIHVAAQMPSAVPCPGDLLSDFQATRKNGCRLLLELIPQATDFYAFKYHAAALAGFLGQGRFGRLLEGFSFYEDQFYHSAFEEPLPERL